MNKRKTARSRLKRVLINLRIFDPERYEAVSSLINRAYFWELTKKREDDPVTNIEIDLAALRRLKSLDAVGFNQLAEQLFVDLIVDYISEEGPQPVLSVVSEASFELDISVETAKRYLTKYTARRAPFILAEKFVALRKPPKPEEPK